MSAPMTLRLITTLSALAAAATLSACMGAPASLDGPIPLTPTQRFTLQVEPGVDRIALAVHETGLSPAQRAAIGDLANRFLIEGAPAVIVEAPAGGDTAANEQAWRVKAALEASGVPADRVRVVGYAAPDPRAPVLAGFETLRAAVPQCGTEWGSLTRSGDNQPASNFGCAVTANLAAQIENPRDIIQPRAMTAADSGRRSVVFDNYRGGQATAAAQEELLANRRVARAVE